MCIELGQVRSERLFYSSKKLKPGVSCCLGHSQHARVEKGGLGVELEKGAVDLWHYVAKEQLGVRDAWLVFFYISQVFQVNPDLWNKS